MQPQLYNPGVEDNAVQTFDFNGLALRALLVDGEPWFIALDVAKGLAYSDAYEMTKRLDSDEIQNRQIAGFGNRGVNIINESGLYEAIFNSRKPEAKERLELENAKMKPIVQEFDEFMGARGTFTAEQAAKLLCRAGIKTGQNRLLKFMDSIGWTSKSGFGARRAVQRYVEQGLIDVQATKYRHPKTGELVVGDPKIVVTPKGLHKLRDRMLPRMDVELLEVA